MPEFKNETLQIIEHLAAIDPLVKFNYLINDENFELAGNILSEPFYEFIKNRGIKYMDVFAFMAEKRNQ